MDLLFKNPQYFFETYFSFSLLGFAIALVISAIVLILLCKNRFEKKLSLILYIAIASVYLATLIGITLLNSNRGVVAKPNLNPLFNIQDMFREYDGVHQIRGCLSNVLLFVPFGVLGAVYFKKHPFRDCLIASFVVSFIIELAQFLFNRGCAETMDVICNVLGAIIGSLITIRIIKTINYFNKRYKE